MGGTKTKLLSRQKRGRSCYLYLTTEKKEEMCARVGIEQSSEVYDFISAWISGCGD